MPTLFERIVAREIPADVVYEDDDLLAFRDIEPQAPVHILIIPKAPIPGLASVEEDDATARILSVARRIAEAEGIAQSGYRLVINQGEHGGQAVPHLHAHVLGGRKLSWPPG